MDFAIAFNGTKNTEFCIFQGLDFLCFKFDFKSFEISNYIPLRFSKTIKDIFGNLKLFL